MEVNYYCNTTLTVLQRTWEIENSKLGPILIFANEYNIVVEVTRGPKSGHMSSGPIE